MDIAEWELHYVVLKGDVSVAEAILIRGGNPNAFDDAGHTPLHCAIDYGHLEIIRLLLQADADVNAYDESCIGDTPLGWAAGSCSFEIAQTLVAAEADPTIRGWMQLNALDRAQEREDEEGKRVYELLCDAARRFGST